MRTFDVVPVWFRSSSGLIAEWLELRWLRNSQLIDKELLKNAVPSRKEASTSALRER